MTELQEGDLVQLHSSVRTPAMSVQAISADGRVATCMWFDADGKLQEKDFLVRTLTKYDPDYGVSGS